MRFLLEGEASRSSGLLSDDLVRWAPTLQPILIPGRLAAEHVVGHERS